jgi:hypothetical protein
VAQEIEDIKCISSYFKYSCRGPDDPAVTTNNIETENTAETKGE